MCFSDTKALFFQPEIQALKSLNLDNTEKTPPITPQKSTAEWSLQTLPALFIGQALDNAVSSLQEPCNPDGSKVWKFNQLFQQHLGTC